MAVASVGEQEHLVLQAVWQLRSCTVRQVHDLVGAPRGLVYTTTAKVLERLHDKGLLTRSRDGATLVYRAGLSPSKVERGRVRALLGRLLGAEPQPAIATLVDAVEAIDPSLLDELAREVQARRKARRGT